MLLSSCLYPALGTAFQGFKEAFTIMFSSGLICTVTVTWNPTEICTCTGAMYGWRPSNHHISTRYQTGKPFHVTCTLLACHFWRRGILSARPVRLQKQFRLIPLALANNKGESFATALLVTGNQLNHSNSLLCTHKPSLLYTSLAHDLLWYTIMYLFHPDGKPETLPKLLNDLKINTEECN